MEKLHIRSLGTGGEGIATLNGLVVFVDGALAGEEIEVIEPIDKSARDLSLDEGGLFPELVAGEAKVEEEEDLMPLLNSKSATGQG